MTITAFLEAAKKADKGEWQFEPNPHCGEVVSSTGVRIFTVCASSMGATRENFGNAELAVAARNAAKEIEELRDLCRAMLDYEKALADEIRAGHETYTQFGGDGNKSCHQRMLKAEIHGAEVVLNNLRTKLDRIREIVGGGV